MAIQEENDSDRERRLRGRKAEMGTSARSGRAKALRKQEGERSERDFASAMGASATQKRSLRNAHPPAFAAPEAGTGCRQDGVPRSTGCCFVLLFRAALSYCCFVLLLLLCESVSGMLDAHGALSGRLVKFTARVEFC